MKISHLVLLLLVTLQSSAFAGLITAVPEMDGGHAVLGLALVTAIVSLYREHIGKSK